MFPSRVDLQIFRLVPIPQYSLCIIHGFSKGDFFIIRKYNDGICHTFLNLLAQISCYILENILICSIHGKNGIWSACGIFLTWINFLHVRHSKWGLSHKLDVMLLRYLRQILNTNACEHSEKNWRTFSFNFGCEKMSIQNNMEEISEKWSFARFLAKENERFHQSWMKMKRSLSEVFWGWDVRQTHTYDIPEALIAHTQQNTEWAVLIQKKSNATTRTPTQPCSINIIIINIGLGSQEIVLLGLFFFWRRKATMECCRHSSHEPIYIVLLKFHSSSTSFPAIFACLIQSSFSTTFSASFPYADSCRMSSQAIGAHIFSTRPSNNYEHVVLSIRTHSMEWENQQHQLLSSSWYIGSQSFSAI